MRVPRMAQAGLGSMLVFLLAGAAAAQTPATPREKKVWTNEDLEELRKRVPLTEFQPVAPPAVASSATPARPSQDFQYVREKDPVWYTQQAGSLRMELARLDQESSEIRSQIANPYTASAGIRLTGSSASISPANQLAMNDMRRADLQKQLDELEYLARRNDQRSAVREP